MDAHPSSVHFGRFQLNTDQRQLSKDNVAVKLGARTFDVLLALVERRERVVSKDELLKIVWPNLVVEENNLEVHVSSLRKVLGATAISTVAGRGYRFTPQIDLDPRPEAAPLSNAGLIASDDDVVSLAVLPFADLSPERDQQYFADGLAEELLNVFCKIRGLRVISRTSAFSFRGTNLDIPTVANKLNVRNVLEGSVRKVGQRVKVALHLIHVETDAPLWSESYDKCMEDIFEVQEEIAQAVVTELRELLQLQSAYRRSYAETKNDVQTALRGRGQDAEAFRLYLQGRYLSDRLKSADMADGIKLLQRAVKMDPGFSLAWANLSDAYFRLTWLDLGDIPAAECFRLGRQAAEMALSLEPDLPEGHVAIGWIRMVHDWDWDGADASFSRALAVAPTHAKSVRSASVLAINLGRTEQALALLLKAVSLDPLNATAHSNLANFYLSIGQLGEAEAAIGAALPLRGHAALAYFILGKLRLMQGRAKEAREAFEKTEGESRIFGRAVTYDAEGLRADADNALASLIERYGKVRPSDVARVYACRGDVDHAFDWLGRAYELRDARLAQLVWDPLLKNLYRDPRWPQLLNKVGIVR